jgi:hypothetical protein
MPIMHSSSKADDSRYPYTTSNTIWYAEDWNTAHSYLYSTTTFTTSSYVLTGSEEFILADATAASSFITLGAPGIGTHFYVKRVNLSNAVTVMTGSTSINIQGASTIPLAVQYDKYSLVQGNASTWFVLGS